MVCRLPVMIFSLITGTINAIIDVRGIPKYPRNIIIIDKQNEVIKK